MNFNLNYESPLLEIIKVQVEQGYQSSGNNNGSIVAPGWG